ncbi:MAG: twitch domain-containing radical SAM protein [Alphaproteobacteria bacterium]|nr:twitch domain-containing radical SAM protein [Alphaproteobacteria bacterium]
MNARLFDIRDRLNEVSPSFCLAKWYQVTLHLQNGHNHSCHHPGTHRTPLAELKRSVDALHNTSLKKELRAQMMRGERPSECAYCWTVEDSSDAAISDRFVKSADPWAAPHLDRARAAGGEDDVTPTYVEVSFSNVCNFACSYCGPWASSKWVEEARREGPYPTSTHFNGIAYQEETGRLPIPEREENPYVEAFWEWWPELYPSLHTFRITGGEPLLTSHTFRVLEWIKAHPHPELRLAINTNLCVPAQLVERFFRLAKEIVNAGAVAALDLFTSVDAYGARAEYMRTGMDYGVWRQNLCRFLEELPSAQAVIMCAFNALSVSSFTRLYHDVETIRKNLGAQAGSRLKVDLPYLRDPAHQSVRILPASYLDRINAARSLVEASPNAGPMESAQLSRILAVLEKSANDPDRDQARADFYLFFNEFDRRRGSSFLASFPEMTPFFRLCRDIALERAQE